MNFKNTKKFIDQMPDGSRVAIITIHLNPSQVPNGEDFEYVFEDLVEESLSKIKANYIDRPEKTQMFSSGIIPDVTGGEFMYETFNIEQT